MAFSIRTRYTAPMDQNPSSAPDIAPRKLAAHGTKTQCEALVRALDADPVLEDLTHAIYVIEEPDHWCVDTYPMNGHLPALRAVMAQHPELKHSDEPLGDADWIAMSLSGLPPVEAGRFFVYGAHDKGRVPQNAISLAIEAGVAFGTGHHGTTEGCLSAFHDVRKQRPFPRVLDVGTGTGVLAMAARKTGSQVVVGTDLDPDSVRIARENTRLNRAPARMVEDSSLTHPAVRENGPYDLVFANILAGPLVQLAPKIVRLTQPGGIIILSGLLHYQMQTVCAAYRRQGAVLKSNVRRDPWRTLVLVNQSK